MRCKPALCSKIKSSLLVLIIIKFAVVKRGNDRLGIFKVGRPKTNDQIS